MRQPLSAIALYFQGNGWPPDALKTMAQKPAPWGRSHLERSILMATQSKIGLISMPRGGPHLADYSIDVAWFFRCPTKVATQVGTHWRWCRESLRPVEPEPICRVPNLSEELRMGGNEQARHRDGRNAGHGRRRCGHFRCSTALPSPRGRSNPSVDDEPSANRVQSWRTRKITSGDIRLPDGLGRRDFTDMIKETVEESNLDCPHCSKHFDQ